MPLPTAGGNQRSHCPRIGVAVRHHDGGNRYALAERAISEAQTRPEKSLYLFILFLKSRSNLVLALKN